MRLLDELELFLSEEKETYKFYPVDYDLESGVSFGVDLADEDETLAKIAIKTIDGVPIDALNGNYNYDDVYADVSIEGDTDDPRNADLMLWVLKKLKNMGYDEQTIRLDGTSYYKKPENLSDIAIDTDSAYDEKELPQADNDEFNPAKYWEDDEEDSDDDSTNEPVSISIDDVKPSDDTDDEDEAIDKPDGEEEDSSETSDAEDESDKEDEDEEEEEKSSKK